MTIRIRIEGADQHDRIEHSGGPLEIGRGPARGVQRILIQDPCVSRDQIRLEEIAQGSMRLENLSQRSPIFLNDGNEIAPRESAVKRLPVTMKIGETTLLIEQTDDVAGDARPCPESPQASSAETITSPLVMATAIPVDGPLHEHHESAGTPSPSPIALDELSLWLKTTIELQDAAVGSSEFYHKTAQALVDLIGLDLGLVLLRGTSWKIVGHAFASDTVSVQFSRTLVEHVATRRQTFYQDLDQLMGQKASLSEVEAAVASPIFGVDGSVVGVLYGVRNRSVIARGSIGPWEAKLVQLLAGTAGANLARSAALKTRVQFEQFFSPALARELEKNPDLLEGKSQEVTVLFSDLRGFTSISEQLGAQRTCRMLRDLMESLSNRIAEHGGVIVDYAGDGILAMWNAPASQEDHQARACHAAVAMLDELPALNERWHDEIQQPLSLGIGINAGEALVGNTGSTRKFKYGPHGSNVNLASRVQDATKRFRLPMLITPSIQHSLPAEYHTRRLGKVQLPGVKEPVMLFELHGQNPPVGWLALREAYEQALALYEAKQWTEACQVLLPTLSRQDQLGRQDVPSLKLMRRAWECFESPPEAFDGILEVITK
jgi:adenylate cyclase